MIGFGRRAGDRRDLVSTSVDAAKLAAAVEAPAELPEIESADWEMSTSE